MLLRLDFKHEPEGSTKLIFTYIYQILVEGL